MSLINSISKCNVFFNLMYNLNFKIMKGKDYFKASGTLKHILTELVNIQNDCDTSFKNLTGEREKDIVEWNEKLNDIIEDIRILEWYMIFTFGIED